MILHLPMLKTIMPGNVTMLFSILIPIVMFDIIDSGWSTELIFNFDFAAEGEKAQEEIMPQMIDLGYEQHNSILNLGSVFVFLVVYIL